MGCVCVHVQVHVYLCLCMIHMTWVREIGAQVESKFRVLFVFETICVLMYGELVPGFLFKDLFDVVKVVITSENNLVAY